MSLDGLFVRNQVVLSLRGSSRPPVWGITPGSTVTSSPPHRLRRRGQASGVDFCPGCTARRARRCATPLPTPQGRLLARLQQRPADCCRYVSVVDLDGSAVYRLLQLHLDDYRDVGRVCPLGLRAGIPDVAAKVDAQAALHEWDPMLAERWRDPEALLLPARAAADHGQPAVCGHGLALPSLGSPCC